MTSNLSLYNKLDLDCDIKEVYPKIRIDIDKDYIIYSCGSIGFKKDNDYYISRHSVCSIIAIFDEIEKFKLNITPVMLYNTIKFSTEIKDGELLDTEHIDQIAEYLKLRIIIHDYNNGNLAKYTSKNKYINIITLYNFNKHYINSYDMNNEKSVNITNFIAVLDLTSNIKNYTNYYFIRNNIINYIKEITKKSFLLDPFESNSLNIIHKNKKEEKINIIKTELFIEIKSDIKDFENYKFFDDNSGIIDNSYIIYKNYITKNQHINIINLFAEFKNILSDYNIYSPIGLLLYLHNFIISFDNREEVCRCMTELLNIKVIDTKTNSEFIPLKKETKKIISSKEFYFI